MTRRRSDDGRNIAQRCSKSEPNVATEIAMTRAGAAVGKPARWSLWKQVLDEIAREELRQGKPDITSIVLSAATGWPSQVDFKSTGDEPDKGQMERAQTKLDEVFRHYCPSKPTPTLPQRKRA